MKTRSTHQHYYICLSITVLEEKSCGTYTMLWSYDTMHRIMPTFLRRGEMPTYNTTVCYMIHGHRTLYSLLYVIKLCTYVCVWDPVSHLCPRTQVYVYIHVGTHRYTYAHTPACHKFAPLSTTLAENYSHTFLCSSNLRYDSSDICFATSRSSILAASSCPFSLAKAAGVLPSLSTIVGSLPPLYRAHKTPASAPRAPQHNVRQCGPSRL